MLKNKNVIRTSLVMLSSICMFISACSNNNPSTVIPDPSYDIVRPSFIPDYDNYGVNEKPSGVNMTFYTDIYSRGFSWLTDEATEGTELYLVQSDKGEQADFSNAQLINGETKKLSYDTSGNITAEGLTKAKGSSNAKAMTLNSHKVHVENLEKGKAYSYKIGSETGYYYYGAFIVDKEQPESITAINMSDAQTKELDKHYVWRNTFVKAVEKAGKGLDLAIHNGDQFDQNNASGNDKEPFRLFRYAKAIDVIQDYKFDIAYMPSAGNHEPTSPYSHYLMSDISYGGYDYKGAYYSYNYGFAHFVTLNSNSLDDSQLNWLKEDLEAAKEAKWKIVTMHISPCSTGDNSNKSDIQKITEKVTPIFSEKHVDLVFQAHDHTYCKTMPYRWDAAGYTTKYDDDEVVNLNPEKVVINDTQYDKNPNGTYYVTTGAAGHRVGEHEKNDGVWADVVVDESGEMKGLYPSKTFTTNKYKTVVGKLTQANQYQSFKVGSYTSEQDYKVGNPATGNVNAQMFGVLNLTNSTLEYDVYTVNDQEVKLFDTLSVLKA